MQLDKGAVNLDKAHRCTEGVVPDDNVCDTTPHEACDSPPSVPLLVSAAAGQFAVSAKRRTTIDALCPPNPKEFETATSRSGRLRATFGT